jgi:hypothetical protein
MLMLILVLASPLQAAEDDQFAAGEDDATGTDPRSFGTKFIPYYRYTDLRNDVEQQDVVAFGLLRFDNRTALTYEIPLATKRDVSRTALGDPATGQCGGSLAGGPPVLSGGLPGEGDCEETGLGDMNLRILYKAGRALGGDWLVGSQFNFPTGSSPEISSEKFEIGPMFAYIKDLEFYPAPGAFAAFMNFYFFDAFGEEKRGDTSYYIGRWFFMLPLRPPGGIFGGIYALPEVQPIYDFEDSHFSFWVGPEVGKLLAPGRILYVKPGWGVDPDGDKGDRRFTFEVGFRYFFD